MNHPPRPPARRVLLAVGLASWFMLPQTAAAYTQARKGAQAAPARGDVAPDFELTPLRFYDFEIDQREITRENAAALYDGVRLSDFRGKKAVALFFAGDTGATRPDELDAFGLLYEAYGDRLQFLFVYIDEPRPGEGPPTDLERMRSANSFVSEREIAAPCLVDGVDDDAAEAYAAYPARAFLVGKDGRIAFAGARGSADADLKDLERAIRADIALPPRRPDPSGLDAPAPTHTRDPQDLSAQ